MTVKKLPTFTALPVADITVPADRLRPISEAKVTALMQVIEAGVFLGAITVRRTGTVNTLIDGAHRLEAMTRLGRETIAADVLECSAAEARQMEITGNLTAGMTPIQDAIFLGVYQQEYEKLHPETKRGVAGALAKQGVQGKNSSFADLIAESRQITSRQVRNVIAAGRALTKAERDALQAVPHRIAMSEIEKLGKIGGEALRARAVGSLLAGKRVADALRAEQAGGDGEAAPEAADDAKVEAAFKALLQAWNRSPKVARRRFVEGIRAEIDGLLHGGDGE
ncbi:MAG: ParB-like nuclease domain-containing protein [Rhodobacter sp.]|nr:ParB-like nuclease domain-containing protein [Rhodobacter sp.]MCA3482075.1 ParB-like nuclease domain-containing protein [Rhodobacter sp.]